MDSIICFLKAAYDFAHDWQTLLAAGVALFAANKTIQRMSKDADDRATEADERRVEAEKQRAEQEELRRRRLSAQRARMSYDLSTIISYTRECVLVSFSALDRVQTRSVVPLPSILVLPQTVRDNLSSLIEQLGDQDQISVIELLECYQIQHSRIRGAADQIHSPERMGVHTLTTEQNIRFTLPRTVVLYLMAISMFDFARRKEDHIPPFKVDQRDIETAANGLAFRALMNADDLAELKNWISDDGYPTT